MKCALVIAALLATACTGPSATPGPSPTPIQASSTAASGAIGSVTVGDADCRSDLHEPFAIGPATVTVTSGATSPAAVGIWRLPEGHSFEELAARVQNERQRGEQSLPPLGHPSYLTDGAFVTVSPGDTHTLDRILVAGTYAIVCVHIEGAEARAFKLFGPFTAG